MLATTDLGNSWNAYDTPLLSSPSADAFIVDFRDPFHGVVGGGDFDPGDPNNARTAISSDGGRTWTLTNPPPVTGAIFGLSYVGQTWSRIRKQSRVRSGHHGKRWRRSLDSR